MRLFFIFMLMAVQLHSKAVGYDDYKSRNYFIKRSLVLNEKIYKNKNRKAVSIYTAKIFDVWHKNRQGKLKYIKNPKYAIALVHSESNFNPKAISSIGCIGLFQLDVRTAKWICKKYGISTKNLKNRLKQEVDFNILVGLCNLNEEMKNAGGRIDLAVLAYKCGSGTVRRNQITRRHIDLYSKFYTYSRFIDGDKKFSNPNKYFYMWSTYTYRS